MKKLKKMWCSIPRPIRAVGNMICIVLLCFAFYYLTDAPVLTMEQAFRRTEKANFVGPSKILVNEAVEAFDFNHMIVAETEMGVITYVRDDSQKSVWDDFYYFPKTGAITVVAAPTRGLPLWMIDFNAKVPIFVVDEYPAAVRAELELYITGSFPYYDDNGEDCTQPLNQRFSAEAWRYSEKSCFRFSLDTTGIKNEVQRREKGCALEALSYAFSDYWSKAKNATITATVRLYDKDENLIIEQKQILTPYVKEASR